MLRRTIVVGLVVMVVILVSSNSIFFLCFFFFVVVVWMGRKGRRALWLAHDASSGDGRKSEEEKGMPVDCIGIEMHDGFV